MRLFLSSQGQWNHSDVLDKLVGENRSVAYISNAKDDWSDKDRAAKVAEHKGEFEDHGFMFQEIDLRNYFNNQGKLLDLLSNFGLLWVSGGNTFILRRAMAASGFDKIIRKLLDNDKIVYAGNSAGPCVAAPSLKGLETDGADFPDIVPPGYDEKIIWEGLNLINFYIVPHYKSDWYGKEANTLEKYYKKHKLPYKTLRDGQSIVINGDREEFLK